MPFGTAPLNLIPAIVYTGLPVITLAAVTGRHHGALFGRFSIKDLGIAIGFGLLTMVASLAVGLVLLQFITMTSNSAAGEIAQVDTVGLVLFLVRTSVQLIGEELMTILPLLAILWLCVRKFGLSRKWGLVIAVALSTMLFSAVHLPTYNWNFLQCFGGIGVARLVLTAAFLVTRKLWVSAGAHIVNDWTEFLVPTLLASGHTPIDPTA